MGGENVAAHPQVGSCVVAGKKETIDIFWKKKKEESI